MHVHMYDDTVVGNEPNMCTLKAFRNHGNMTNSYDSLRQTPVEIMIRDDMYFKHFQDFLRNLPLQIINASMVCCRELHNSLIRRYRAFINIQFSTQLRDTTFRQLFSGRTEAIIITWYFTEIVQMLRNTIIK